MPQKERFKTAFSFMRKIGAESADMKKLEAVIYAMAEKFLDSVDLEEIMEDISMTKIGQMLVDRGIAQGLEQGVNLEKLEAAKGFLDLLAPEIIAERIGLPPETVLKLKEETK